MEKTTEYDLVKWKGIYIRRLIKRGIDREEAGVIFDAGLDSFDFSNDPIDAADDELSYMSNDADREMVGDDSGFFGGDIGFK